MRYLWLIFISVFLSSATMAAEEKPSLTFGVHPYLSPQQLLDKFNPLLAYLSEQTQTKITLQIGQNYQHHVDSFIGGELDFAYFGPASYVELIDAIAEKQPSKPNLLARLEIKGKPTFRGAIVVADDKQFKTLADLKGKRFAFGSKHSTMSYVVPRYHLIEAGVDVEANKYAFVGNHNNVALGVLTGQFDAGGVKEAVYFKQAEQGLKLLQWTTPISEHVLVAQQGLDAKLTQKLRTALLALEDKAILTKIKPTLTGFVGAKDSDYDNLRTILTTVKTPLAK